VSGGVALSRRLRGCIVFPMFSCTAGFVGCTARRLTSHKHPHPHTFTFTFTFAFTFTFTSPSARLLPLISGRPSWHLDYPWCRTARDGSGSLLAHQRRRTPEAARGWWTADGRRGGDCARIGEARRDQTITPLLPDRAAAGEATSTCLLELFVPTKSSLDEPAAIHASL